jgi:hypothetical protein
MPKNRCILNVFLASPGGVDEERGVAEEVVNGINRKIGRELGWQIDLYKWEDKTPAFGRPQEIINREMVDTCGLFIGLLWKWWGQQTGKYSSGFEEEFERVKARHKEQGEPEIWLFFKTIDPDSLKDPGPQLVSVLAFREAQIALREVLFKEVGSTEDWRKELYEGLSEYLVKIALSAQNSQRQLATTAPVLSAENAEVGSSSDAKSLERIPQQLTVVSSLLARAIGEGKLDFSRENTNLLHEFEVVRLYLLSATWMSRRYTAELLGTHEINLLYKHRKELESTTAERFLLLRTVVGSGGSLAPGWFWFRRLTPEQVTGWLITLSAKDSAGGVRARAMGMLASAGIRISKSAWRSLPFSDDSLAVQDQAYEYLVRMGDEDALTLLDSLEADGHDPSDGSIRVARLKLLARLDPSKALTDAIRKEEYISDSEMRILEKGFSTVDEGVLLKGIESSVEQVRKLSLEELIRRNLVTIPIASELAHDPSAAVRAKAFESLAKAGALPDFGEVRKRLSEEDSSVAAGKTTLYGLMSAHLPTAEPDSDSIIVTFYRTQSIDYLLKAVDWYSVDGPLAYQALVQDHYEQFSSQLRADLLDGFSRIKRESVERKNEEFGAEVWRRVAAELDKYDDSRQRWFTKSALIALAASGSASDAELARPYLSHSDVFLRDAARAVICEFGGAEDLDELVKITTDAWGDLRQTAASAALRLSPRPLEVAYELTKNSDSEVVRIAFGWLFAQDSQDVKDFFLGLLHDENDTNRVRALHYFSRWVTRSELEEFLEIYITGETYYYDVVTWLDRLVYSPSPLREMFVRDLKQQANHTDE